MSCYKPPPVNPGDLCQYDDCDELAVDRVKRDGVMIKVCYDHLIGEDLPPDLILVRSCWTDPIYF